MKQNISLNSDEITHWFNAIRNLPDDQKYRALEGMWDTQIQSKAWIVNELNRLITEPSNIYIFGGWIGILSSMLFQGSSFQINKIRSIDIDPWCEQIADTVCKSHEMNNWRFKAITHDMSTYSYQSDISPDIIINTSTEHVTQNIYDLWYSNIPKGCLVIIQGNNFYSCDEHVRCSNSIEDFEYMNYVHNPLYSGVLSNSDYDRYMSIWRK